MARPVRVTVTSVTSSAVIPLNHRGISNFNVGLFADITAGTATYVVEYTFDDVFSETFVPGSATWTAVSGMSASADSSGSLAFPVTGVRLRVTAAAAGSVTLTIIQQN